MDLAGRKFPAPHQTKDLPPARRGDGSEHRGAGGQVHANILVETKMIVKPGHPGVHFVAFLVPDARHLFPHACCSHLTTVTARTDPPVVGLKLTRYPAHAAKSRQSQRARPPASI